MMEILLVVVLVLGITVALLYQMLLRERRRARDAVQDAFLRAGERVKKAEKAIRADAAKRSKYVLRGKVAEQLAPFLDDFGYDPRDARFLGSPVDYVVFDGLSEGDLVRIVLIEVKTGLSRLSSRERLVRDAVRLGEVDYEVVRIGGKDERTEGT